MSALVECVPNFSEGRDAGKIKQITAAIQAVEGITLLDVDPGKDTNRTVVTFVGSLSAVEEAAYRAIRQAAEVIDMREQEGAHPRMGATDVCPFIPVSDVTMDECVALSERVGKRVGEELGIPVYLYEYSARRPERKNLARIREGEYEGLEKKLRDPEWRPDFGPAEFNPRSGATVMGAREFLIAYNINLNTKDKRLATDIAFEIREKGRTVRIPHPESNNYLDGSIIRYREGKYPCSFCDHIAGSVTALIAHHEQKHDFDIRSYWEEIGYSEDQLPGKPVKRPGKFKHVKAIGWYIDTFKRAQISINFTNYKVSTIHDVFDKVCELAVTRGVRVTGSELVGLIPLKALLMAGRHYLNKQQRTTGIPEKELVEVAVQSLGLNDVTPFIPEEKIIDYAVKTEAGKLMNLTVNEFTAELSANSPAPGGGSVSALAGSLGAALTSMVAAITHEKKGYFEQKPFLSAIGDEAQQLMDHLSSLVDEDTKAFNQVMDANRLPSGSDEEQARKREALAEANRFAIRVPLEVAEKSLRVLELAKIMVEKGNPNSVSDAGVAGETALAAVRGAGLNVLINLSGIDGDEEYVKETKKTIYELIEKAEKLRAEIFSKTISIISKA
ncbi:MAG: glutamate formimidoyltransferase [FCB group bacterium]|nr:glutamate formimidoyltransferase [FCB group bacterium]